MTIRGKTLFRSDASRRRTATRTTARTTIVAMPFICSVFGVVLFGFGFGFTSSAFVSSFAFGGVDFSNINSNSNSDRRCGHSCGPASSLSRGSSSSSSCCSCCCRSSYQPKTNGNSKLVLHGFLDGLFGGDGPNENETDKLTAILATYNIDIDATDNDTIDIGVRFESLADYITNKWIDLFVSGTISLTTPVKVYKTTTTTTAEDPAIEINNNDEENTETIVDSQGCRLVFQKVDNTGYNESSSKDDNDQKKDEKDDPKQGGVEIQVQSISAATATTQSKQKQQQHSLRVIARRCEVDESTMIKEMSEEIIVNELQKAIGVWKKETR